MVIAPAVWLIRPLKVPLAAPLTRVMTAGEALVLTTVPVPTRAPTEIRGAVPTPGQFGPGAPAALRSRVAP